MTEPKPAFMSPMFLQYGSDAKTLMPCYPFLNLQKERVGRRRYANQK
jgi:hypothetical protein